MTEKRKIAIEHKVKIKFEGKQIGTGVVDEEGRLLSAELDVTDDELPSVLMPRMFSIGLAEPPSWTEEEYLQGLPFTD